MEPLGKQEPSTPINILKLKLKAIAHTVFSSLFGNFENFDT